MRHQLDTEIRRKVQNMQYKTIVAYEYNTWFLKVDGGSGLWYISVYGTPIFTRLLSPLLRFRGCHHNAPLHARNLAKTIARDKPVSTFECTRKHHENRYNIAGDNHALNNPRSLSQSQNKTHDARKQEIKNAPFGCLKRRLERIII